MEHTHAVGRRSVLEGHDVPRHWGLLLVVDTQVDLLDPHCIEEGSAAPRQSLRHSWNGALDIDGVHQGTAQQKRYSVEKSSDRGGNVVHG